jgi:hypothetical protein
MKTLKTLSAWFESWLIWLPATGVAWAMSLVMAVAAAGALGPRLPLAASLALAGLAGGALIGLGQRLLLEPQVRGVGLWILVCALAWPVSLAAATVPLTWFNPVWAIPVGGVLGGAVLGLAQSLALRPASSRVSWFLMTVLGWTVAFGLNLLVPNLVWSTRYDGIVYVAVSVMAGLVLLSIVAVFARILLFPDFGKKDATDHVRWWM